MQESMSRGWLETHDTGQLLTGRMGGNQGVLHQQRNTPRIRLPQCCVPMNLPNLPSRQPSPGTPGTALAGSPLSSELSAPQQGRKRTTLHD